MNDIITPTIMEVNEIKYAIYTTLAFVSFMLFVPTTGSTKIRNIPLLVALLTAITLYLLTHAIKRIIYISKTNQALKKMGCSIIYSRIVPNFLSLKGRYDIKAKRADTTLNITLLKVRKASWHAHFEGINKLEYYISTHAVVHGGNNSQGSRVTKATSTRCIAKKRLPFDIKNTEKYILVLDKLPSLISDRTKTNLSAGDLIENKILLTTISELDKIFDI